MFERFTDRARRAVVLAQEAARNLKHEYIGTEHVLLGLMSEEEGIASRALVALGITPARVRDEIGAIVGFGENTPSGHMPFTPRVKRVLNLSLREALQHGHNYIGTEHLLLGIVREGEGVAAQVLVKLGVRSSDIRAEVAKLLGVEPKAAAAGGAGVETLSARFEDVKKALTERLASRPSSTEPLCPRCDRPLADFARYRVLQVPEHGGPGSASVLFLFCVACGTTIDDVILPGE